MQKEAMLTAVEQSPRAVAAGDKEAWLDMFSELAVIEDPVGSAPHISSIFDAKSGRRGNDALSRFYNTFIAGNRIEFLTDKDYVAGNKVLRDLALRLEVNGMQATVPMHLLYELVSEQDELKVQRLSAHWEFLPISRQMVSSNVGGMLGYSQRLLKGLGFWGVMGFLRALRSVGATGKQTVARFVAANNSRQLVEIQQLFASRAQGIAFPADSVFITPQQFIDKKIQLTASKLIAAGNRVSCSLELRQGEEIRAGAALFEFDWKTRKLDKLQIFS
jgi:hypothetical protein